MAAPGQGHACALATDQKAPPLGCLPNCHSSGDAANVRNAQVLAESVNSPVLAGLIPCQAERSARTSRMSSAREVTPAFWKTLRRW
jgi:hypothetical protein